MHLSYFLAACMSWTWLPHKVSADWKLDASCNKAASDVRTAMNAALDNSRAVVAMQKNRYFLRAAGYIIKPALIPNAVQRHANILEYFSKESTWENSRLSSFDVIVYCDLSRFETRTTKNSNGQTVITHYDDELKVDWPEGLSWSGCSGPGFPVLVSAVTTRLGRRYLGKPDTVQICPWYLNWSVSQKFKDSSQVKPSWLVDVLPETQAFLDAIEKTKMDLRTGFLLDIILSHELTHTTKAGLSSDFLPAKLGWEYSVGLASVGNKNAENLAQLGATAALIQNEDVMPDKAGNIVPLSLEA